MRRFVLLVLISLIFAPRVRSLTRVVTLRFLTEDFAVVLDDLPPEIDLDTLVRLYDYLREHVDDSDDCQFLDYLEQTPIILQYRPHQPEMFFPHSTEGYAGMMGIASMHCLPHEENPDLLTCLISPSTSETCKPDHIRLALVNIADYAPLNTVDMLWGFTVHELTHAFGSIDGARCPSYEEYVPRQKLPPDPSDAYWWFGVQGVFKLRPAGIFWKALTDQCAESTAPDICRDLQAIMQPTHTRD